MDTSLPGKNAKAPAAPEHLPPFDAKFLKGLKLTGYEDETVARLMQANHLIEAGASSSYKPLLPLLLSLKGHPYTLDRVGNGRHSPGYAPFEPFFRTRFARKTLFKTGRQVAKSTGLSARGIVHSNCTPWFSTLYVAPLFEQIRRFSQNYMRPFIENSPVKSLLISSATVNSVLQRTFLNNSQMLFSFAFMNADRTRGISANKVSIDEIQDMDKDFLPIIYEVMSASPWGDIVEMAGTPKSLENTIEGQWQSSSQAEWMMKCVKCGHWNVPSLTHDLEDMIGPHYDDISYTNPGLVCGRCKQRKSVFPHLGRWVHAYPERRWDFAGYHIPQVIMPMHYGNDQKWNLLLAKRAGRGNTPIHVFYNEVCGESYDTGSRIITMTELKRAATLPWAPKLDEAAKHIKLEDYTLRVLACDWGGGGEDEVSFTAMAVLGVLPTGEIHVLWGLRSLTPHDHIREARLCIGAIQRFKCDLFAHDFTGAGSLRETFIRQAGYPLNRIINVAYVRAGATARIMSWKQPTKMQPRAYYQVDKSRSLQLTCNQIKMQMVKFFRWDYTDSEDTGLIYDFLALVDEKVESRIGKDVYTIIRDPNMRDDFAQAVNIGCCTIWNALDRWPDVAAIAARRASEDLMNEFHPESDLTDRDWGSELPFMVDQQTLNAIALPDKDVLGGLD